MDPIPKISIVIPVRNEEKFIAETLNMLLKQDYPKDKIEILVCDGESDDRTEEIVRGIAEEHPQVKFFISKKRRSSAGRNVGQGNR